MKKSRTALAVALLTAMCAFSMAGCGSSNTTETEAAQAAEAADGEMSDDYAGAAAAPEDEADAETMSPEASDFFGKSSDEQIEAYQDMDGEEAYQIISESRSQWFLTTYDLITPENIKEIITIYANSDGTTSFKLDRPGYGCYDPETIGSIADLEGEDLDVSKVGNDDTYTLYYGTNENNSQYTASQRSLPQSSAKTSVGTLDIDLYKKTVDIIVQDMADESKIADLEELGFDVEASMNMITDYTTWLTRSDISGDNSIPAGAASVGHTVDGTYGYYGKCASWSVTGLTMEGGANQMCPIYTWRTLKTSGLLTETATLSTD